MKPIASIPCAILAAAALLLAGRLSAQAPPDSSALTPAMKLLASEAALELKCAQMELDPQSRPPAGLTASRDAVMDQLGAAPKDSATVRQIAGQSLVRFYSGKHSAESAPQATQINTEETYRLTLLAVQQNQRVIELLEQLAAAKK